MCPTNSPPASDDHAVIARVVDDAPTLTESTRSRLAALLRPSSRRDPVVESQRATMGGAA